MTHLLNRIFYTRAEQGPTRGGGGGGVRAVTRKGDGGMCVGLCVVCRSVCGV